MKLLSIQYPCDPNIATEETMFKRLIDSNALSDEYTLCALPLAHMINTLGVPSTQYEIDKVKVDGKKLFICQHILVDRLKFDADSVVATPHTTTNGSHISIPHYPVHVDTSRMKEERSMLFSFMGSVQTHEVRRGLTVLYKNNCFDSGHLWALDPAIPNKQELADKYVDMLGDSDFSLCPRGTGISSVRLFESMAMGSIPVIIADGYRPPLHSKIDWPTIAVFVQQRQISKIGASLQQGFTPQGVKDMRKRVLDAYHEYFSPEHFEKSIELSIA